MANRRVLVKRRKAVANIRKITRTMQLIATARFQAAFSRVTAAKPYVEKLAELVGELPTGGEGVAHPLLAPANPKAPAALLVLTSHRGLCGGYNGNVLRTAIAALDEVQAPAPPPELHAFGKKGIAYFRFLRRALASQHLEVADAPRYDQVEPVANELMARFLAGEISAVAVVHMRFFSAGQQSPEIVPLLPLAAPPHSTARRAERRGAELEFHPDPKTLLDELLPAIARIRLYQAFLEAAVSEQSARMVAMKAATDAAEDTIKALTRKYNRARQTHITMELLDIVGGANALA